MGGWLAVGFALISAGRADDTACAAMGAAAFSGLVAEARASIDAEDIDAFDRWSTELERRIPCLTFVPDPAEWSAWLVAVAAVNHFRGRDWQTPLTAALRAAPEVDRLVGPGHEIAVWAPPPPPPPAGRVPSRVELFVDGRNTDFLPAPVGMYLVQVRTELGYTSRLLRDEPVPRDLVASPPSGVAFGLVASAAVGLAQQGQRVDRPDPFAGDWRKTVPDAGIQARMAVGGRVGVLAELDATTARWLDGRIAGGVRTAFGSLGLGVGVTSIRRREGGETRQQLLAAPALVASGWTGGRTTVDGGGSVALGPALRHAALRAGLTAPGERIRVRIGLEGRLAGGVYDQPGTGRTLTATDLRVLAQTGVVWGMW